MTISFLDLPGEIRNPIYKHLLISREPIEICVCTGNLRRTAPKFPRHRIWQLEDSEEENAMDCLCRPPMLGAGPTTGILVANRQTHAEGNHLFYSANRFVIFTAKTAALSAFLDRIGPQNAGLIRHLCIPFPHVRVRLDLEATWSSDDEESPAGPPSVRHYESVKNDPEFRVSNPAVLDMISQRCTSLETLETVIGTAHRLDPNVEKRRLVDKAMLFLDSRIRDGIPSLKRVVINFYDWHGEFRQRRPKTSGWQWIRGLPSLGWTVVLS